MRKVFCLKYQQELPGLAQPPLPGERGQFVYEHVSQRAWDDWLEHQKMLINEKRLQLFDAQARAYLMKQMDLFLQNKDYDKPAGYVPPAKTEESAP